MKLTMKYNHHNYKSVHEGRLSFLGVMAAIIAASKASFTPSPDLAEVSQYLKALIFFANFSPNKLILIFCQARRAYPIITETTHPPTPPTRNFKSSLNKSIQVLHQHMVHFWDP